MLFSSWMKTESENVESAGRTSLTKGLTVEVLREQLDAQVSSLGEFGAGKGNVSRLHLLFKAKLL